MKRLFYFTNYRVLVSLVGPSETEKSQLVYNWHKIGTSSQKFDKNLFFYQHSQPLYDVIKTEIWKIEFFQGVNFKFTDSLKNNGAKYSVIFDDSCEEVFNSKAYFDVATAGRSTLRLSTTCSIKTSKGKRLSSKTRTLFSWDLPRIWCMSVCLVHNWDPNQS